VSRTVYKLMQIIFIKLRFQHAVPLAPCHSFLKWRIKYRVPAVGRLTLLTIALAVMHN